MVKIRTLTIITFYLYVCAANASGILLKQIRIPMQTAQPNGLEAILVWPDTPGKHPLALISHGSHEREWQRAKMTAISYLPIAQEFAKRGFVAAVVLRRGYGTSDGGWAESYGKCSHPNYPQAASAAAQDLHAATTYLFTLPQVDSSKMIAIGVSGGGFATIAFTSDAPPKSLRAAISFAGGRGSRKDGDICQLDALLATFAQLGKTSRIPMLWVYAKNDQLFNPAVAQKFFQAFTTSGGIATFVLAPAFGSNGHLLFSNAGIPQWTPIVDDFLKKIEFNKDNSNPNQ